MNRQILILRIMSAFFFLSGILTIIILFIAKTASALYLTYTVIYILIMVAISVGVFKLIPWARYAAIIVFMLKTVQFLMVTIRDIRTMNSHSFGGTLPPLTVLTTVIVTALYLSAIWWLGKSSTKEIFTHKST